MKTLIEGSQDILDGKKYFECDSCGWAGCAVRNEYKSEEASSFGFSHYYYVECPFCKDKAYEVENEKSLLKLKRLDWNRAKATLGHWIRVNNKNLFIPTYKCSVCNGDSGTWRSPFCSWCGSPMSEDFQVFGDEDFES